MYPDDRFQLSPFSDTMTIREEKEPKASSTRDPGTRAQEKRQKEKIRHAAEMEAMHQIRGVLSKGEYTLGQEAIMKLGLGDVLKMAIHYIDDLRWYLAYSDACESSPTDATTGCCEQSPEVNYKSEYGPHAPPKPQEECYVPKTRPRKRRAPLQRDDDVPMKRVLSHPRLHQQATYANMVEVRMSESSSPLSSGSSSPRLCHSAPMLNYHQGSCNNHGFSFEQQQQQQQHRHRQASIVNDFPRGEETDLMQDLQDILTGNLWTVSSA